MRKIDLFIYVNDYTYRYLAIRIIRMFRIRIKRTEASMLEDYTIFYIVFSKFGIWYGYIRTKKLRIHLN
jgi:hypothetical protein